VKHNPTGPGLAWKLRNLTWAYVLGWIAYHIGPALGRLLGFATITSRLLIRLKRADGSWVDYGVASYRLVTTAFVTALATALHTQASPGNLYYHACGTGTTAANVADTGMETECTTTLNPDSTRATGTHTSSAGVYESAATVTFDGSAAVTEHGVMGAASGASTLIDRHVFSAINVVSGDTIVFTYQLTLTAGG
jgi:hypothetical protein